MVLSRISQPVPKTRFLFFYESTHDDLLFQTPDLLDTSSISASSMVTTPRDYFTPRSVHSSASISKASVTSVTPNSPRDATLSSPLEVISEDETATQSAATDGSADNSDLRKFKMRPPKMSSFTTDAPKAAEFQVHYVPANHPKRFTRPTPWLILSGPRLI